ncbi:RNB domain-containing ribonuclease [Gordonia desulfuricans]|uniref:RNB domain-containing ribonuclease n=1 Tax=Gordonia desulfuricans TaxID=89051 RepID=A0A7K3LTD9_9ACTN|nr:RNB domain-containing ribonuclease [Gordonia desulfuricans]NDK91544.1 RNB domain-containing ribonuclease [Gordonia desulfuricans]
MQRRLSAPDIDFDAIRGELGVDANYGQDALTEAENAVDRHAADRIDRTDIPLVTIDPPGSMDLDQAVCLRADDDDIVVDYAIADVAALIEPEGALDSESRRRGATIYFPDRSVPLHPRVLSEGRGSLLPDVERAAVLWTMRVSGAGEVVEVSVARARVRSRARLDYAGVAADAAAGRLHPSIVDLPRFGELRRRTALARGAIELDLPDQEVVRSPSDGPWTLQIAPRTPADMWNSQVSLMTGMCAGTIMADAGIGLLRTLPPAPADAVEQLRATAAALRVPWPDGATPGEFLAGLPQDAPSTLALMSHAGTLMRGAGYKVLDAGEPELTHDEMVHAAIGGIYAHVTAPLRRLGDRFATEVCLSVSAGRPVPDWVVRALPTLPKILRSADSLGSSADRESIDLTESVVLAGRVGERFDAVVLSAGTDKRPAKIFVTEPPVIAACSGTPDAAVRLPVVLAAADPDTRSVEFAPA